MLVLALALVAVGSDARAEPTAAERETARTLLFSGREKRKTGKLHEALADFERAHGIMRVPTTGLDLGRTQEALGLLVEARATLLDVVRSPVQADEPRAFKRARQEAKELADAIAPRLSTLTVTVPAAARVKVDGAELSASSVGAPLKVNPGRHEIDASLNGEDKRSAVELGEGESKSVQLTFVASSPSPATVAAAAVATPPTETRTEKDTRKAETKTSPLVWVGVASAAVGAAVGATTGLMAFSAKSDVASRCQADGGKYRCPAPTYADIDCGERLAMISTVSFVIAGVGALLLTYGLLNPQELHSPASSARLVLSPFGASGTF